MTIKHRTAKVLLELLTLMLVLVACTSARTPQEKLARLWASKDASANERCVAINQCFTNGTPISQVVAVLGNNYLLVIPYSGITAPGGTLTRSLDYELGGGKSITIGTTARLDGDELAAKFTGAGVLQLTPLTNVAGTVIEPNPAH